MICPGFWKSQCGAIRGERVDTGFPPRNAAPGAGEAVPHRAFSRHPAQSLGVVEVKPRAERQPLPKGISPGLAEALAPAARAARNQLKLTVVQLAQLTHSSPAAISRLENAGPVSAYIAAKIAGELDGMMNARGMKSDLTTLIKSKEYN